MVDKLLCPGCRCYTKQDDLDNGFCVWCTGKRPYDPHEMQDTIRDMNKQLLSWALSTGESHLVKNAIDKKKTIVSVHTAKEYVEAVRQLPKESLIIFDETGKVPKVLIRRC